ncbi:MAG TPA: cysteine--tRNA ligase [Spirochaetota bacterium]|nr:cysteine--tRNA ligase [Spirochaetota bacterium]HOM38200.1 cysteine--tRNA ligase [Spirochaetota bacterium]HPQ48582.1 cysteine--tRNA ligase [Spirochaetota bacterium]
MRELVIYNTLTKKKEIFKTINPGKVGIYTCGPTVYNFVHIGNLRTFIFEDLFVRFLRYIGYDVTHVMNITDVDDKTIRGSKNENIKLSDYTYKYKKAFFEDIETLNIVKANYYPEATKHIKEMVNIIKTLLEKGIAYKTEDGSIYFSISKFKEYGKLSGFNPDELKDGASGRVKLDEYSKDQPVDFVLWKSYNEDDGDVFWETEVGKGRPGWHIECSAMSMKYLGDTFDIHCGGIDNIFPHHENEIAQSKAYSGKDLANYWVHSAFLNVNNEKMAKSKGNFYTLRDLLDKGYHPMAIRYSLISTHYRQPLNFSEELIKQSQSTLNRIKEFIVRIKSIKKDKTEINVDDIIIKSKNAFVENLLDDLNISPALAAFFEFIRKINSKYDDLGKDSIEKILGFIKEVDKVIGCFDHLFKDENLDKEIEQLIKEREEARRNKDFKKADEIRNKLLSKGIILKDTKEGTIWEKI